MDTTALETFQARFKTLNWKGDEIKPAEGATSSSKCRCAPTSRGSAARLHKCASFLQEGGGAKSFTDRSGRRTGTDLAIVDASKLVLQ